MGYIKINQDKVTKENAKALSDLCPFNAFDYIDSYLSINAACKVCKICVNKGPNNICEFIEEEIKSIDKTKYNGITVYLEHRNQKPHPVGFELIGKAKELSKESKEPVYGLLIGHNVQHIAQEALEYGVDTVFYYDDETLEEFNIERYTNILEDYFNQKEVNVILFGGTSQGRSFAPKVAARLKTGLTADCTMLEMNQKDLIQIRPAFGGNIMAKINTPNHRPQLATIRYKMFNKPSKVQPFGTIIQMDTSHIKKDSTITILKSLEKEQEKDISESEVLIAIGNAFKKEKDIDLVYPLQKALGADLACTRPLIEKGWMSAKKQIGLSGRTVKPKLIINLGISGAVQFIEGMKESELIISVNSSIDNALFDISDYSIIGDIYEIIPKLTELIHSLKEV